MIKDEENIIQVYGPNEPHSPQAIVINEAGQKALKKALDEGRSITSINAITADGNGCYVKLIIASAEIIEDEYDFPFLNSKQNEEKIDPRMVQDIKKG